MQQLVTRAVLAVLLAAQWSTPVWAQNASGVVISQFAGRGPSGSNDDFVEIFNAASAPVDITGWTLQTCFGSSGSLSSRGGVDGSFLLQPGQFYLFANTISSPGYSLGVAPDAVISSGVADLGTGQFNGRSGIRLVDAGGAAVDQVGSPPGAIYPAGSPCQEGTGIVTPAATGINTALFRLSLGGVYQDSNNNAADFPGPATAGMPRNSSGGGTGPTPPSVRLIAPAPNSFSEAGGSAEVTVSLTSAASVTVTVELLFSGSATRDVDYTPSATSLSLPPGALSGTVTLSAIDDGVFEGNETVAVSLGTISGATAGSPASVSVFLIEDDAAPPVIGPHIYELQGSGHVSPMVGNVVSNVPGIVTAVAADGFYFQDGDGDGDPDTSDGIFVATGGAPSVTVGQQVLVSGQVSEVRPAGLATNLTVTQLNSPSLISASGLFINSIITPVIIGAAGRVPPVQIIDNDSLGNVETSDSGLFDPTEDGLDFYESLEGMRVQVDQARVSGPRLVGSSVWVVGDNGAAATGGNARGGITQVQRTEGLDNNPERIQLQGGLNGIVLPAADVGDSFAVVQGVVSYDAGNYALRLTGAPSLSRNGLQPAVKTLVLGGDRLSLTAYNLANLDPADTARIARIAAQIAGSLGAPDLLALSEVRDSSGAVDNGVIAADLTIQRLIDAIVAAGGPRYAWTQIDPANNADGGDGGPAIGGNIRSVQLYNAARLSLVAGSVGAGDATSSTAVSFVDGRLVLSLSPGRIDPANSAFNGSRKPLAASYDFNGRRLIVIAAHFNERDSDQPLFGVNQPPLLLSEAQRRLQATVVHDFVFGALALDPAARIAVLGDFNDFAFSPALGVLESGADGRQPALLNLGTQLIADATARYGNIADGNARELDHVLVTAALNAAAPAFETVHLNAEFADQASDHDVLLASFLLPANLTPSASGLANPDTAAGNAPVLLDGSGSTDPDGSIASYSWVQTGGTAVSLNDADSAIAGFTSPAATPTPQLLSFTLTVTDNEGATASATVTVTISATAADTTPDAFAFTAINGAEPGSVQTSDAVTISSIAAAAPVSVANGSYSINGGTFTTAAGTVVAGDLLHIRLTASSNFSATITATLIVGGVPGEFRVTTRSANTTPTPFSFAPATGVEPGATLTSGSIVVTGIEGPAGISIVNGLYSINNGSFTAMLGAVVNSADTVRVQVFASTGFATTTVAILTIGGVDGRYSVTTRAADTVPDVFSFAAVSGAEPGAAIDSSSVVIAGLEAPAPIAVANGRYSINGAAFTDVAGLIGNGDSLRVQQTAASGFALTAITDLSIGGVSASFAVTTRAADTTPDAFSFAPVTDAALLATVGSAAITVSGLEASAPIAVANGQYSINDRPFTSPVGLVSNGDVVRVQQTTSNMPSTTTVATLTIGVVSGDFRVTTSAAVIPPGPNPGPAPGSGGGGAVDPSWLLALLLLRRRRAAA